MNNVRVKVVRGIFLCIALLSMMLVSTCQIINAAYTAEAVPYSVSSNIYWIINAHSGKALTVYNSGTTTGTNVIQSENVNGANQRWEVNTIYNPTYANEEYSIFVPVCAYGKYLSVSSSSLSNGINVQLGSSGTSSTTHWDITQIGTNGNYKITSKCGSTYALTVHNASLDNNSNVFAYTYNSGIPCNDEWILVPVAGSALETVTVKVQMDASIGVQYLNDSYAVPAVFSDAAKPFYNKFHIQLVPSYYNVSYVPADDCPNTSYTAMCDPSNPICRPNSDCKNELNSENHHKNICYNALYVFNNLSMSGFDLRLVMTAQNACYINNAGDHNNLILGLAYSGYDSMIVKCNEYSRGHMLNVRVVQHELSHMFGCPDHEENGEDCIMSSGFDKNYKYNLDDIWCSSCEAVFNRTKY